MPRCCLLGALPLLLLACGSSPPATPETPKPVDGAETDPAPALANSAAPKGDVPPPAPAPKGDPEIVAENDPCAPVGQVFEKKVRPDFKNCYREGKKKDPNLEGSAKFIVNVDLNGKVASVKSLDDKSTLGPSVVQCMFSAVKKAAFDDGAKCKGKSVLIPVEFPTK